MHYALGGVFAAVLMLGSVGDAEAATLNFFQPVDNSGRVGYLALNNVTTTASNVTLTARDDAGTAAPGGTITLTLASRQSIYLSSSDLEKRSRDYLNQMRHHKSNGARLYLAGC